MKIDHLTIREFVDVQVYSHQAKVGAKAKKIKQQSRDRSNNIKHFFAFVSAFTQCEWLLRLRFYWYESESDITSRWVHRECNLMLTLSSDKDQRNKTGGICLGVCARGGGLSA